MVKCVVSGCQNRVVNVNRGVFSRPPKRFFSFPRDPARVKVWLAALRETDKDSTEQHMICEDHFLPEDISSNGVNSDAIPIMPPCLDGPLGMIGPWGAESSDEEDQWAAGGGDLEDLLLKSPKGLVDLKHAATSLHTRRRRVYDITNVLEGIKLIEWHSVNTFKWIGNLPVSSFVRQKDIQGEMENLKLVEDTLDSLIKSCAQQLFHMTDDLQNSAYPFTSDQSRGTLAYVTHEDISRVTSFQDQTVITVKAPEETKLEIPAPKEDSIQVHLKACKGPIVVMTCDIGTRDVTGEPSGCFSTLEESRIRTTSFHTGKAFNKLDSCY
ncbi:transcription factor E2F6 [Xenentodon cancila]